MHKKKNFKSTKITFSTIEFSLKISTHKKNNTHALNNGLLYTQHNPNNITAIVYCSLYMDCFPTLYTMYISVFIHVPFVSIIFQLFQFVFFLFFESWRKIKTLVYCSQKKIRSLHILLFSISTRNLKNAETHKENGKFFTVEQRTQTHSILYRQPFMHIL